MKTSTSLLVAALLLSGCGQPSSTDTAAPSKEPLAAAPARVENAAPVVAPRRFTVPVDGLPIMGQRDALVTIVEFTDYECPYCVRAEHTMHALREKYGADLRVAVASRPLPMHTHAQEAALAALAADEQGRFETMHDKLFERTDKLSSEGIASAGAELGLGSTFERARGGDKARAALEKASLLASSLKVTGTPTFFINGRKISGAQPQAVFELVVLEELLHARELVAQGVAREDVYTRILAEARANPANVDEDVANEPKSFVAEAKTLGGAHMLGTKNAPRTLVLFTDFECPYCAKLDARLRDLTQKHPEMRVVLRNHPLPMHPHARLAAKAALAADAPGRLAQYSALLFENQTALERDALIAYAARAGLDSERFVRDLDAPETERRLAEDEALATKLDVRGTPTSFVDGRRVVGAQGDATFEEALGRTAK
jgi:protein-disulfide isomerase